MAVFMGGFSHRLSADVRVDRLKWIAVRRARREQYDYGVPERALTFDELTGLLEHLPLERAGGRTFEDATEAQIQLLLARIAALTAVLRDAAPNEPARLASRMLLTDLTAVSAHFRGRGNTMRSRLANVLADLRDVRQESADAS